MPAYPQFFKTEGDLCVLSHGVTLKLVGVQAQLRVHHLVRVYQNNQKINFEKKEVHLVHLMDIPPLNDACFQFAHRLIVIAAIFIIS